ncbi:MAG TPA: phasin family protein [Stellaceae bacterium]|nr:phasin family protein [Stellaceae bacterium]
MPTLHFRRIAPFWQTAVVPAPVAVNETVQWGKGMGQKGSKNGVALDGVLAQHERNVNALNGVAKLALQSAQEFVGESCDFVIEAHRSFAVLLLNGATPGVDGAMGSYTELGQKMVDNSLANALKMSEMANKLQRESLSVLRQSISENFETMRRAFSEGLRSNRGEQD